MISIENELPVYHGDTFKIIMHRYSDPQRLNMARNAAVYLGKPDRDNIRRPLSILKQGHVPEVFRGEYVEFEFIDVSLEVYNHLVTYTTRNMRVAGGNRALTSDDFTMPSDRVKDVELVETLIQDSMENYKDLLRSGEVPQVARSAMPVNAKLNPFVYQFNFVTLMNAIFPQRIFDKGAQGNTVKVVKGMWELVHSVDPELWDLVEELKGSEAIGWEKVRAKLKKDNAELYSELLQKYGQIKSMWE